MGNDNFKELSELQVVAAQCAVEVINAQHKTIEIKTKINEVKTVLVQIDSRFKRAVLMRDWLKENIKFYQNRLADLNSRTINQLSEETLCVAIDKENECIDDEISEEMKESGDFLEIRPDFSSKDEIIEFIKVMEEKLLHVKSEVSDSRNEFKRTSENEKALSNSLEQHQKENINFIRDQTLFLLQLMHEKFPDLFEETKKILRHELNSVGIDFMSIIKKIFFTCLDCLKIEIFSSSSSGLLEYICSIKKTKQFQVLYETKTGKTDLSVLLEEQSINRQVIHEIYSTAFLSLIEMIESILQEAGLLLLEKSAPDASFFEKFVESYEKHGLFNAASVSATTATPSEAATTSKSSEEKAVTARQLRTTRAKFSAAVASSSSESSSHPSPFFVRPSGSAPNKAAASSIPLGKRQN
ncbi:MAG: hypothetical protein HY939_00595 [Gammaproteobacteria bacterium]|nr:hypothetical protein [Gammaproteobacteria bacterium]